MSGARLSLQWRWLAAGLAAAALLAIAQHAAGGSRAPPAAAAALAAAAITAGQRAAAVIVPRGVRAWSRSEGGSDEALLLPPHRRPRTLIEPRALQPQDVPPPPPSVLPPHQTRALLDAAAGLAAYLHKRYSGSGSSGGPLAVLPDGSLETRVALVAFDDSTATVLPMWLERASDLGLPALLIQCLSPASLSRCKAVNPERAAFSCVPAFEGAAPAAAVARRAAAGNDTAASGAVSVDDDWDTGPADSSTKGSGTTSTTAQTQGSDGDGSSGGDGAAADNPEIAGGIDFHDLSFVKAWAAGEVRRHVTRAAGAAELLAAGYTVLALEPDTLLLDSPWCKLGAAPSSTSTTGGAALPDVVAVSGYFGGPSGGWGQDFDHPPLPRPWRLRRHLISPRVLLVRPLPPPSSRVDAPVPPAAAEPPFDYPTLPLPRLPPRLLSKGYAPAAALMRAYAQRLACELLPEVGDALPGVECPSAAGAPASSFLLPRRRRRRVADGGDSGPPVVQEGSAKLFLASGATSAGLLTHVFSRRYVGARIALAAASLFTEEVNAPRREHVCGPTDPAALAAFAAAAGAGGASSSTVNASAPRPPLRCASVTSVGGHGVRLRVLPYRRAPLLRHVHPPGVDDEAILLLVDEPGAPPNGNKDEKGGVDPVAASYGLPQPGVWWEGDRVSLWSRDTARCPVAVHLAYGEQGLPSGASNEDMHYRAWEAQRGGGGGMPAGADAGVAEEWLAPPWAGSGPGKAGAGAGGSVFLYRPTSQLVEGTFHALTVDIYQHCLNHRRALCSAEA